MSSARLHDIRSIYNNELYSCALAMNNPKNKIKKAIPITITSKRIKILGCGFNKRNAKFTL